MRKQIRAQEEKTVKSSAPSEPSSQPLPQYLLDRGKGNEAKALSSKIKEKRNEKAAKFSVPLPKVRGISEEEMFKVVKTGKKTAKKGWKRMITKPTFGRHILLLSQSAPGNSLGVLRFKGSRLTPWLRDSWTRLHPPPRKIRTLYSAYGSAV